eukprot:jgi/Tetstr1/439769/TSEL_028182.t1
MVAGAEARPPLIDERELNFLILHYLRSGPCGEAAALLEQQFTQQGLLPRRVDFEGEEHNGTYGELIARHRQLGPAHLPRLLERLVAGPQAREREGAALPSLLSLPVAKGANAHGSYARGDVLGLKPLMMREIGSARAPRASTLHKQSAAFQIPKLSHMSTVRGHRLETYCVVWDRTASRFATGSDDHLLKIWSARTGLLISTCRGHNGEVTDLSVSICNNFVASSSNDASVRVWHFTGPKTGHPQCLLLGHTAPVSYLDFHPKLPHVLLSSSFDSTCRIWNVLDAGAPAMVLHPVPSGFGPHRLLVATAAGQHPLAASYWTGSRQQQARSEHEAAAAAERANIAAAEGAAGGEHAGEAPAAPMALLCCSFSSCGAFIVAGGTDCSSYLWHWNTAVPLPSSAQASGLAAYPLPVEVSKLSGHRNDISIVAFSTSGHAIASASKDGNVLVWKRSNTRAGRAPRFDMWMCLKCDIDGQEQGASRQARRRASVPAVNQAVWTKDDQRIVTALSDNTLRVFDTSVRAAGSAVDLASGKGRLLFILRGHVQQVHVLSAHPSSPSVVMSAGYDGRVCVWDVVKGELLKTFTTDHRGGTERDPVPVLDGHFSADGHSVVVTDVAGQASIYHTGSPHPFRLAQYDQFLASDYAPVLRDSNGNVVDAESQASASVVAPHLMPPQPLVNLANTPYPVAYQQAYQAGALEIAAADGLLEGQPATGWATLAGRRWLLNTTSPPVLMAAFWQASTQGLNDRAITRRVQEAEERYQADHQQAQFIEAGLISAPPAAAPQAGRRLPVVSAPRTGVTAFAGAGSPLGARPSPVAQRGGSGGVQLTPVQNRRGPPRPRPPPRLRVTPVTPRTAAAREEDEEPEYVASSSSEESEAEVMEESSDSSDDETWRSPGRRRRRGGARGGGRGAGGAGSSRRPEPELPAESSRGRQIKRRRLSDEEENSEEERRRKRKGKRVRTQEEKDKKKKKKKANRKDKQPRGSTRAGGDEIEESLAARNLECYAWLQALEPGIPTSQYVPQEGDEVVYLKEQQKTLLSLTSDKLTKAAWQQLKVSYDALRQAEKCRVTGLEYFIHASTRETGVRCTLAFEVLGSRSVTVELLPPDKEDATVQFLVPIERFVNATSRPWRAGDKCQIFFVDEGLWRAEIVRDAGYETAQEAGTLQEEMLPWDGVPLVQRYKVAWAVGDGGSFDYGLLDLVDPWEILEDGRDAEELMEEIPRLEAAVTERMLAAVGNYLNDDAYAVFHEQEAPDACYDGRFYNALVPLPISLSDISMRLQNHWYRSADGLMRDIRLLHENCICYNGLPMTDGDIGAFSEFMMQDLGSILLGNGPMPYGPNALDDGAAQDEAQVEGAASGSAAAEELAAAAPRLETAMPAGEGSDGGRRTRRLRVRLPPVRAS